MRLKVLTPTGILIDETVSKVLVEAHNGVFCLLPRHIDFATAMVPGLLSFVNESGQEVFLAVDEGILVKKGIEVRASTRRAVITDNLVTLRHTVEEEFKQLDEREKQLRSSLARLEADVLRRFVDLGGKHGSRV